MIVIYELMNHKLKKNVMFFAITLHLFVYVLLCAMAMHLFLSS